MMIEGQYREVLGTESGDRRIWEHLKDVDRPTFVPEEATAFRAVRKWAAQFTNLPCDDDRSGHLLALQCSHLAIRECE
jgi:hypothetical protein